MNESDPPKITYLVTGLQYGGATVGMARLLSELEPDEFDVTVVAIADTPPDVVPMLPDHVTVRHLKLRSKTSIHGLRPLVRILRRTDILVCSLFHATLVGVPLGTILRVPNILVWQHSTSYPNRFRSLYYRFAYRVADRVLADSEAVNSMLRDSFNISAAKISTLPIAGIDTERLRPGQQKTEAPIKIGTIGRLVDLKGYPELLEVARGLSTYQFYIIGDGPQYDQYVNCAPENVHFLGRVGADEDQFLEQLQDWDIYFQPSRHEGLCMTVIEAMACGLPVVASTAGGITESVVPGETGYLCEPGDVECFCEWLEYLAKHEDVRSELGANGRQRVTENYSSKALADAFRRAVAKTANQ